MKNLTVKIFVGLFVVATVLLQSCKKDSETYSFLLNERGAFVEEPGGTTSLGFTAINISSVTPTTVPQGWSVTVDMNERRISVTAPTTFPDDPKTLADGEEEEEENTNVRFGTVYLTGVRPADRAFPLRSMFRSPRRSISRGNPPIATSSTSRMHATAST